LDKEENQVGHLVIGSPPMLHIDDDDYIDDELVLYIPNVVMENPFNNSKGLDTNSDIDETYIQMDEVQDQSDMHT